MSIDRDLARAVLHAAREYPVVTVTGPRQSGKTTLVRRLFADLPYVLLEDPDHRRLATEDPRGFLARYGDGVVLDEAQRAPELFSYLQGLVDDDPTPGRFILTGSQQFGLLSGITQSLAGRAAMTVMLPFNLRELEFGGWLPDRLEDLLLQGLYPPVHDRGMDASKWYGNYVQTYLERDVRQLVNVRDLNTFEVFLRMCAGRCGQLINLSGLAGDCGITHNTARSWLSVLEASYVVRTLQPHYRNFSKRLTKSPKLYFLDPGLAAWLLQIRNADQLVGHPMRGPLFETWVFSELIKARYNRGEPPNLYFWRDRTGLEVDFLADLGTSLVPIEAKSGATFVTDWLQSLQRWTDLAGDASDQAYVVFGGGESARCKGIDAVPWRGISQVLDTCAGATL
jgi:uncharacterized protein